MLISFTEAARVELIAPRALAASANHLLDVSANRARVAEHFIEALLAGA